MDIRCMITELVEAASVAARDGAGHYERLAVQEARNELEDEIGKIRENSAEDIALVREMVREAHKVGLMSEVLLQFGREIINGSAIHTAAGAAMYEWDMTKGDKP